MQYEYYRDAEEYYRIGRTVSRGHFHRAIELVYCLKFPKTVIIDGVEMTLGEGELLFVPPFSTHVFPNREGHSSLCVVLPLSYTDIYDAHVNGKCFENLIVSDKELAKSIYTMLTQLEKTTSPLTRSGIYSYALGALLEQATLVEKKLNHSNIFAIRVLTFFEKHYSEALSLASVAAALGYSRTYFSAKFKSIFHSGFCEYLSMLRIKKSLALLGKQPVSKIAFTIGFGSSQSYYTNFKKVMGTTPSAYLNKKQVL